jgi:hypothetical protein
LPWDVNVKYFEKIDSTASDNHASRRISGRCVLVGISITPMYEIVTSGSVNTKGTIQIKNMNEAKTGGTTIGEFPVVSAKNYGVATHLSLSDDDGGVLFEDGIYLGDTTEGGTGVGRPLQNFSLILYYQSGEAGLDA